MTAAENHTNDPVFLCAEEKAHCQLDLQAQKASVDMKPEELVPRVDESQRGSGKTPLDNSATSTVLRSMKRCRPLYFSMIQDATWLRDNDTSLVLERLWLERIDAHR